jgi:hypothetical protein
MVGQAFSFDGSNDRAQAADSPSLAVTGSMTIEGWLRVDAFPAGAPADHGEILFRGDDRGGLDPYSLSVEPNGNLLFQVSGLSGGVGVQAPVPTGQFVHVAATLDDATGAMRLYVNGELAASMTTTVRPFADLDPASNPSVGIGNHGGYPTSPHNFPFDGLIDELSIYNRALTGEEVQQIYGAGSAGKIKSPDYIAADFVSVTEGNTGSTATAVFTVQRVGNLAGIATVDWATADGTATAGSDYVAASGQVVFQDGESQKTVEITVNGDDTPEPDESFNLLLTNATPGYEVGNGQATILDDDVTISVVGDSAIEGSNALKFLDRFVADGSGGLAIPRQSIFGPDGMSALSPTKSCATTARPERFSTCSWPREAAASTVPATWRSARMAASMCPVLTGTRCCATTGHRADSSTQSRAGLPRRWVWSSPPTEGS